MHARTPGHVANCTLHASSREEVDTDALPRPEPEVCVVNRWVTPPGVLTSCLLRDGLPGEC